MAFVLLSILSSIVLSFLALSYSAPVGSKPTGIITPVLKNVTTLQYYATLQMGNALSNQNLVLDLGGELLWFDCDNYKSSLYRPIGCGSRKCKDAKGSGCVSCNGIPRPGCTNNTCGVYGYNPYANLLYSQGLGEDTITVKSTNGGHNLSDHGVPNFELSCSDSSILEGFYIDITGSLGLAKTNIAFHKQISTAFKLAHKFSLCLPSGYANRSGSIFIGEDPSKLIVFTTPLITNPVSTAPIYTEGDASDEYFININSIKVDGESVPLNMSLLAIDKNGVGGAKISTTSNYTTLHTSIYKAITKEFVKKAASKKIKRVASVKPFGACFSTKTISTVTTGPDVPVIDLVLQSEDVYWRIYGHNSMVEVNNDVVCLAFTDGGLEPRTSIVLGGHQLEDNLVQFDLDSSNLGFSNSLHRLKTTCSDYPLY